MIHTEDNQFVLPSDPIYEVQYRRYNAETSLAEPTIVMAETAPGKIWRYWNGCKKACDRLNGLPPEPVVNTVKMIAP